MIKRNSFRVWPIFLLSFICIARVGDAAGNQDKFKWKTASPESQDISREKLEKLWMTLEMRGTRALLIVRKDRIVYEKYSGGYDRTKKHYTASLAKSLVGGMSLLVALNDGLIQTDDLACKYIPQWREDPLKSKITIRHLATHSSGIEDAETPGKSHINAGGWKEKFWKRDPDPFSIVRDQSPVIFEPGTQYAYSSPGTAMLAYAVTASVKDAPQTDIYSLLKERIMNPIGIPESDWSIGYGKTYNLDGMKLYATWGGANFTPRAVARVGRLMLRKGDWQGRQIVSPQWVEKTVSYAGTPVSDREPKDPVPSSGLCWWTNHDGIWPSLPCDAFVGAGAQNQILLVVPSLDLIVVRNGSSLSQKGLWGRIRKRFGRPVKWNEDFWGNTEKYLFNPIMEAICKEAL